MSLKQPYVDKQQYALEATHPKPAVAIASAPLLRVRPFDSTPMTGALPFVYRHDESRYETDFYNVFFIPANEQLSEIARRWLTQAGFPTLPPSSRVEGDIILEGSLARLYGDYRKTDDPQAVMELDLALVDNRGIKPGLLFQKSYKGTALMQKKDPANLVQGWNTALAQILSELESDLWKQEVFPALP